MKKTIAILISFAMIFALVACGNSAGQTEQTSTENPSSVETQPIETSDDAQGESSTTQDTESADSTESQPAESEASEEQGTRILVAYFSATNTTEGVAEHIANGLSSDLYEIVPEEPYTDADLNYNDNNSRSTIEMNDSSSRPAISGSVENMDQYDIVFIGYPIWWGEAPKIVSTFMESYDFSGKTIVPFCTSGGSGMGKTNEGLEKSCPGAKLMAGKLLNGVSNTEMKAWAESIL